jgi:hypothetical protein
MESVIDGMESRPKTEKYKLSLDAMRGRAAIPYNSLCELMPYQVLRSWINKKTNRGSSFYFGGASFKKVELLFVLCVLYEFFNRRSIPQQYPCRFG